MLLHHVHMGSAYELHEQPSEACTGASVSNASESHASRCSNVWLVFDLEEKFTVTKVRSLTARPTRQPMGVLGRIRVAARATDATAARTPTPSLEG